MKEFIFKQYVDNICNHMGMSSSELFVKSRKAEIVDARQLLFYLCSEKRKMAFTEIKSYADKVGLVQDVSNIAHAVHRFKEKLEKDPDLSFIIKKIDKIEY
jgi:chromosomal replication initiation ATPase DnaA